jgi:hypothetical protein
LKGRDVVDVSWLKALVSQLAEELDSKPRQCEFESHRGHQSAAVAFVGEICADLLRTT